MKLDNVLHLYKNIIIIYMQHKKTKQKGGLILPYKNTSIEQSEQLFIEFIQNSDISVVCSGAFGITLLAKKRTTATNNIYKIVSPSEKMGEPADSLLIKLSIISQSHTRILNGVSGGILGTVSYADFQNEINVQTDIYLKSMEYLQPICPGIVYANILRPIITSNGKEIEILNILIKNSVSRKIKDGLTGIAKSINSGTDKKLGVIGMEYIGNGETLYSKNATVKNPLFSNISRYLILKMALDTGYNHNDFHTGNVMICDDNTYFSGINFRPILIDFGRARKITPNIMSEIRTEVSNKNYIKALSLLCNLNISHEVVSDPTYNSFYGWVCGDYNITDKQYETELANMLLNDMNAEIDDYNDHHSVSKPYYTETDAKNKLATLVTPLDLSINSELDNLFNSRELAIDNNIKIMETLHETNPDRYPLLPVPNNIKNQLYNGMIGGAKHKYTRRIHKNRKNNSRKNKFRKNKSRKNKSRK